MKFNIFFTMTGPSKKIIDAPNALNPVESENMASLLSELSSHLPSVMGIEVVGVRIEKYQDHSANLAGLDRDGMGRQPCSPDWGK